MRDAYLTRHNLKIKSQLFDFKLRWQYGQTSKILSLPIRAKKVVTVASREATRVGYASKVAIRIVGV